MCALLFIVACSTPRTEAPRVPTPAASPAAPERLFLLAPASGHEHEIDIFRPDTPPPAGGYPVVLLLDGNRVSQFLRDAQRTGTRLTAVYVTVGYRGSEEFAVKERALDYTPETAEGARLPDPLDPARVNGGAGDFLRFLERDLKPAVSRRVHVAWSESTLWGHSYGGLFVLCAMLENPRGFAHYVAVDPSLWWRDAFVYERLTREQPNDRVSLQLLQANENLAHGSHGRDPARVALRERLHAALPKDGFAQVATRWGASHRDYPSHHHGSLFTQSLRELLSTGKR